MPNAAFFVATLAAMALLVLPAAAQIDGVDCTGLGINCDKDGDTSQTLIDYIRNILIVFLTVIGIIAVIAVIWGGAQYITSAGDSNKAEKAKTTIIYAVVGLIIIGLSLVLVNFVLSAITAPAVP